MSSEIFDIVISGGGMVGASLACALAEEEQRQIAIIERAAAAQTKSPPKSSFDARGTALSLSSKYFFSQLGLWETIERNSAKVRCLHISADRKRIAASLNCRDINEAALCYVVENHALGAILIERALSQKNITWLAPFEARRPKIRQQEVKLQLNTPESLQTIPSEKRDISGRLLVIAEGANSKLCHALGLEQLYDQREEYSALVATTAPKEPHMLESDAYQLFDGEDVLAALPLTPGAKGEERAKLVWSAPRHRIEDLMQCSEEQFLGRVNDALSVLTGGFKRCGKRIIYPLQTSRASEQMRRRVLVLGNSALSMHPIAAQGFNLALRDITELKRMLTKEISDCGELQLLERFASRRSIDRKAVALFTAKLPQLLKSSGPSAAKAISLTMRLLGEIRPLRSEFTRFASGLKNFQGAAARR